MRKTFLESAYTSRSYEGSSTSSAALQTMMDGDEEHYIGRFIQAAAKEERCRKVAPVSQVAAPLLDELSDALKNLPHGALLPQAQSPAPRSRGAKAQVAAPKSAVPSQFSGPRVNDSGSASKSEKITYDQPADGKMRNAITIKNGVLFSRHEEAGIDGEEGSRAPQHADRYCFFQGTDEGGHRWDLFIPKHIVSDNLTRDVRKQFQKHGSLSVGSFRFSPEFLPNNARCVIRETEQKDRILYRLLEKKAPGFDLKRAAVLSRTNDVYKLTQGEGDQSSSWEIKDGLVAAECGKRLRQMDNVYAENGKIGIGSLMVHAPADVSDALYTIPLSARQGLHRQDMWDPAVHGASGGRG
jgi:hypothetical protein